MDRLRAKILISAFISLTALILLSVFTDKNAVSDVSAASDGAVRITLPYSAKAGEDLRPFKALYVAGGYHSIDTGVPAWGSSNYADVRLIGDKMGTLDITYADGGNQRDERVAGFAGAVLGADARRGSLRVGKMRRGSGRIRLERRNGAQGSRRAQGTD